MFRGQWAITPEKRCHRGGNGDVYQRRSGQATVEMNTCARPQWGTVLREEEAVSVDMTLQSRPHTLDEIREKCHVDSGTSTAIAFAFTAERHVR